MRMSRLALSNRLGRDIPVDTQIRRTGRSAVYTPPPISMSESSGLGVNKYTDYGAARRAFALWLTTSTDASGEQRGFCLDCEDPATSMSPSASYNFGKGKFYCQKGDHGGAIYDLAQRHDLDVAGPVGHTGPETAKRELPPPFSDQDKPLVDWPDVLLSEHCTQQREYLMVTRGLTLETIQRRKIGFNSGRYTIPIFDGQAGVVRDIKRYKPDGDPKMLHTKGYGSPAMLAFTGDLAGNSLPVLLTAGEFDAILTAQHGEGHLVAVTSNGGEASIPVNLDRLAGREVFVVYDADATGRRGAQKVARALRALGATVYVVDLTRFGLPFSESHGEDLTDFWMHRGGSLEKLLAEMSRLRSSPEESAKNPVIVNPGSSGISQDSSGQRRLVLRRASDIRSRVQKFLWRNKIPLGALAIFAGRGGVGKSTFAQWLAVQAQFGRLPGDLSDEPITVLYVSVEDHWETQMKPRLTAAGANMDTFMQLAIGYEEDDDGERYPRLPEDTPLIREAIEQTGARLVILDPITSSIDGDDHKRNVVRNVLDPLAKVAAETDSVILGIMHFNKGAGAASDKVSGSHAFRDAARAVMLFAQDEDSGTVVMSQDKGNYAEMSEMSLEYQLVDTEVRLDDGAVAHVARVHIVGETGVSVSQLINRTPSDDGEIMYWLEALMSSYSGPVPAKEALAAGADAGYTKQQLARARDRSRPKVLSRKTAMDGGWEWSYEESDRPEESRVFPEEPRYLNTEFFTDSSGQRYFTRPYKARPDDDADDGTDDESQPTELES